MEELKAKISNEVNELGNSVEEKGSNLTLLLSQLVEKFAGKGMAIDYQFDNLEIECHYGRR